MRNQGKKNQSGTTVNTMTALACDVTSFLDSPDYYFEEQLCFNMLQKKPKKKTETMTTLNTERTTAEKGHNI